MTDNTETDASTKANTSKVKVDPLPIINYTEEELLALGGEEIEVEMKCTSCGYEEEVPEWILEEFLEIELLQGETKRVYSCQCPRCNQTMFRK